MENSLLKTAVGTAAVVALLTMPPLAVAETVVPPGNSAATQYTETFPTTGGNAEVNSSINGGIGGRGGGGGHGGGRSPEKVLGSSTAHQLEAHGEEGRTVAQLATDAAPADTGKAHRGSGQGPGGGGGNGSGKAGGAGQGGGGQEGTGPSLDALASGGSSGFSEVLSHATGSSSGELGIVLPLVLLLTPLCALAFVWRRRQQDQVTS